MKILLIFIAFFSTPTHADMQSMLDNLKSHNEKIMDLKQLQQKQEKTVEDRATSGFDLSNKSIDELFVMYKKQLAKFKTCKNRACFQLTINDANEIIHEIRFLLTLQPLQIMNKLASKNCTDCKTKGAK